MRSLRHAVATTGPARPIVNRTALSGPQRALTAAGYVVDAGDHRGHGRTARSVERLGDFGPGGWPALMADIGQLAGMARREFPGLPLVNRSEDDPQPYGFCNASISRRSGQSTGAREAGGLGGWSPPTLGDEIISALVALVDRVIVGSWRSRAATSCPDALQRRRRGSFGRERTRYFRF